MMFFSYIIIIQFIHFDKVDYYNRNILKEILNTEMILKEFFGHFTTLY